jgi:lantibiotic transport system ATP-binding protein
MPPAIETHRLQRRFSEHVAVADVSMHVPEHAVYGFLGRNGAGKTTTLKMLLGLLRPDAGRIVIQGRTVEPGRPPDRPIGALLEAHGFYAGLSGRDNLDLYRRLLGCPADEIDRVLGLVEMREAARRRVGGYSLGMRQRLGIARALLGAPSLLLLDEPANGLDPEGMADMRAFLRTLPARTGATVVVSSHLLGEIEQTATHVGIVRRGRLVREGALDTLKARLGASLTLRTDNPERTAAIAREAAGEVSTTGDGLRVHFADADDLPARTAALVRALCAAGIAVHAITPERPTLDALYAEASASHATETDACPA